MAKYVFHCDACGCNIVTDGQAVKGMTEIPLAPVPRTTMKIKPSDENVPNSPKAFPWDEVEEVKPPIDTSVIPRRRMFKCVGCGRGVVVRGFNVPTKIKEKDEKTIDPFGREARSDGRTLPPDVTPGI